MYRNNSGVGKSRAPGLSKPFVSPLISSREGAATSNNSVPKQANVCESVPSPAIASGGQIQKTKNTAPTRTFKEMPPPKQIPPKRNPASVAMEKSSSDVSIQEVSSQSFQNINRRRISAVNLDIPPPVGVWKGNNEVCKSLFECGIALYPNRRPELYVEGSLFRREFAKRIQTPTNPDVLHSCEDVIAFVESYIDDKERFIQALLPSLLRPEDQVDDADYHRQPQDVTQFEQQQSFLRLLLGIDQLQHSISVLLMERLVDYSEERSSSSKGVDLPFMIVSQFKWLEHVVEPDKLIALFLEAIQLDDLRVVSRELISALPEIFGDSQHAAIVEKLQPLLDDPRSSYLADVLDTFSNLNLDGDQVEILCQQVIEALDSMAVENIPAALKFILSTTTSDTVMDIISQVRSKLDIDDEDYCATFSNEQKQSLFKLIFGELKSSLLLNSNQMQSWVKLYLQQPPSMMDENVKQQFELHPFDFTMLVIIHSVSFKKKSIEQILKVRRKLGLVSDKTIQVSFKRYHEVLGEHLKAIVAIADGCVRQSDTLICSFGKLIYTEAFCEFDNVCVRQDIVGNLVTHVFGLPMGQSNCAMDILLHLSEKNPEKLICFRVFVRNMLDVLDILNLSDVRKLYRILANLAFADSVSLSDVERTRFKDDLYLIIRKQLAFAGPENAKYRQFGVLAAAMLARGIGLWTKSHQPNDEDSMELGPGTSNDSNPLNAISMEITQLFHLVLNSVQKGENASSKHKDVASLALFYDELSILVQNGCLPSETVSWLSEKLPSMFARDFLQDENQSSVKIDRLVFEPHSFCLTQDDDDSYQTLMIFDVTANLMMKPGMFEFYFLKSSNIKQTI